MRKILGITSIFVAVSVVANPCSQAEKNQLRGSDLGRERAAEICGESEDCDSGERKIMRRIGLTTQRVAEICDGETPVSNTRSRIQESSRASQSPMPTNPVSNICQTPSMWCQIVQWGPIRSACWCNTPFGPLSGILTPRQ